MVLEIDYLKVGQHLKKLRSELGITQDQVAKDLGCTVAFVSNVEHNRAKMKSSCDHVLCGTLQRLAGGYSILAAGRRGVCLSEQSQWLDQEALDVFHMFPEEEQLRLIQTLRMWAPGVEADRQGISAVLHYFSKEAAGKKQSRSWSRLRDCCF